MKAILCFMLSITLINAAVQLGDWLLAALGLLAAYQCWHYGRSLRIKPDPEDTFSPFDWIDNQRLYYDDRDVDGLLRIAEWLLLTLTAGLVAWLIWR